MLKYKQTCSLPNVPLVETGYPSLAVNLLVIKYHIIIVTEELRNLSAKNSRSELCVN